MIAKWTDSDGREWRLDGDEGHPGGTATLGNDVKITLRRTFNHVGLAIPFHDRKALYKWVVCGELPEGADVVVPF